MNIAMVTGASSGLGAEYVKQLDAAGCYNEIWVIARRKERLTALQREVKTRLRPLAYDLTDSQSFALLSALLKKHKPNVQMLINGAGFGKIGSYRDISVNQCSQMIDLNCKAAVALTQTVLPYMHRGGHILEICSTASFQPFPYLNVYSASKAFLYRYSLSLGRELAGTGIVVTAVCPYWIKDTEFIGTARKTRDSHYINNFAFSTRKKDVVKRSLRASQKGLAVSTPGLACTFHHFISKFIPCGVLMNLWDRFRKL